MLTKIIKVINLLALIESVAWMSTNSDHEPKITTLILFATIIGLEFREEKFRFKNPDVQLFKEFISTLPSNGDMYYISITDMEGAVDRRCLRQLRKFVDTWNNAEHEFIDKGLEKKRKELLVQIDEFLTFFGLNTFSINEHFQRMPQEWEFKDPQKHRTVANRLNSYTGEIFRLHQEFIREARKKLSIAYEKEPTS